MTLWQKETQLRAWPYPLPVKLAVAERIRDERLHMATNEAQREMILQYYVSKVDGLIAEAPNCML